MTDYDNGRDNTLGAVNDPPAKVDPSVLAAVDVERCKDLMRHYGERAVLVFGSNMSGKHGAGAARSASIDYGAKWGVAEGRTSPRSYAIPTKRYWQDPRGLPLDTIARSVDTFLAYALAHPLCIFVVTRIGCGYAGYTDEQIAPLFAKASELFNVCLPEGWETKRKTRFDRPDDA